MILALPVCKGHAYVLCHWMLSHPMKQCHFHPRCRDEKAQTHICFPEHLSKPFSFCRSHSLPISLLQISQLWNDEEMGTQASGCGTLAVRPIFIITLLLLTGQQRSRARNFYLVHDTGPYLRASLELTQGTNGPFLGEL